MSQTKYFATFPAGCFDIIVKSLKGFTLDELKIIEHDDSSVLFSSSFPKEKLIELRFFTNMYIFVQDLGRLKDSDLKGEYFRVMLLSNGEPKAFESEERSEIERSISRTLKLKPSAHLSLNDFYVIERSHGLRFLGLRLSRAKFKREKIPAGELRPELAHVLCLASGVKSKDVMLDMFAGYGAIPIEAVRGFGCKQVIAVDTAVLQGRHEHEAIEWYKGDARRLDFMMSGTIDRIVSDPPWGKYDGKTEEELSLFYEDFTQEMKRVLKPGAIAVILTGWPQAEKIFISQLSLIKKWPVLVSGNKAVIYKLQKL